MPYKDRTVQLKYFKQYNKTRRSVVEQRAVNKESYYKHRQSRLAKCRIHHLKSNYNLTEAQYIEMYSRQDGRCAICGKKKKLVVDHNHANKEIRGLLCYRCNAGLGYIEDRNFTECAMAYLARHLTQKGG